MVIKCAAPSWLWSAETVQGAVSFLVLITVLYWRGCAAVNTIDKSLSAQDGQLNIVGVFFCLFCFLQDNPVYCCAGSWQVLGKAGNVRTDQHQLQEYGKVEIQKIRGCACSGWITTDTGADGQIHVGNPASTWKCGQCLLLCSRVHARVVPAGAVDAQAVAQAGRYRCSGQRVCISNYSQL